VSHLWRQRSPDGLPEQITFGPTEEEGVAMAPDGRSVVTSVGTRQSSVWLHTPVGERLISSEGYAFAPQLSPDGRRVYYLLQPNRASPARELRVVNLDAGSTQTVLRDLPVEDYEVSRDDREVVFTVRQTDGQPEIWLAPLDRRTPPRLIADAGDSVSFGAGGDLLFRSLEEEANFLSRVGKDGSGRERVSNLPILNKFGVSPDGNWTLVAAPGTGERAAPVTVAISTRGDPAQQVCSEQTCRGRWSADGRFLYLYPVPAIDDLTLAVPLPPGSSLPALPPSGLPAVTRDGAGFPGALLIEHSGVVPGPDPSTYAFVQTDLQRNLFRIPLR